MTRYRLTEFGVERLEAGCSTFIDPDPDQPAWREFQAWCALGHRAITATSRPAFPAAPPPPKELWIVGAGGYGREIFGMSQTALGHDTAWRAAGFLNDVTDALDDFPGFPPIRHGTDYEPRENDVFACAIGAIAGRKEVCAKLRSRGARFVNLVQPFACISPGVALGEGLIIEAFSGIGVNARIGDFSIILGHVNIGHDVQLGEFVQVSPFASVLGRVKVGDEVLIGSHAVILPGLEIGAGATIGAGSVVIQNVPAGATVFGVPAKRLC